MAKIQYLVGADPELFIQNKAGKFISAHDVIPGNKMIPHEVLSGAIQVDGTAAEFNIHPAATAEGFSGNIRDVLLELSERVQEKNKDYQLVVFPTATFDAKYFKKLPAFAKTLGCSPDFDAWTDERNPAPKTNKPFRTGGGHIHVGWGKSFGLTDTAHLYDCRMATKQLDSVLYPMSMLWDNDKTRRELYGSIGAFRPKSYGVEYRPLSNAWVADPDLHIWIFNATIHAMDLLDDENVLVFQDPIATKMIERVLMGEDVDRRDLLEYHDTLVNDFFFPPLPSTYASITDPF